MSPLQKIAMGLVFVIGIAPFPADPDPSWKHYDGLADPIGWLLIVAGVLALTRAQPGFDVLRWPAWIAAAISVPMWFPQLNHQLDDSGKWALSLPQIAFCLLLARAIAERGAEQEPADAYATKRFGLLIWGFALLAILPPIAIGGDVQALDDTTVLVALIVNVVFVYYLFRVHRREWLGGPGPLLVELPGNDEGRPPSQ